MDEKEKGLVGKNENIPAQKVPVMRFMGRPDIPTLFIDNFIFSKRPDATVITSGIQGVPGAEIEQLRFLVTEDHARKFLDSLAKLIDYYPVKNNTQDKTPQLEPKAEKAKKAVSAKQKKFVSQKKQASK